MKIVNMNKWADIITLSALINQSVSRHHQRFVSRETQILPHEMVVLFSCITFIKKRVRVTNPKTVS